LCYEANALSRTLPRGVVISTWANAELRFTALCVADRSSNAAVDPLFDPVWFTGVAILIDIDGQTVEFQVAAGMDRANNPWDSAVLVAVAVPTVASHPGIVRRVRRHTGDQVAHAAPRGFPPP